ncbi:MAG: LysR family transcriptional regulator substrate-binding protein, partial [Clostridia bacterium]|nr:LysR family transcriptional regulator substrate-binding protein [Clostridia bacterium]
MLPCIRAVLYQQHVLQEQVNDLNGMRSGTIRIGTFTSVSSQWLPGMIRLFRMDYPGIRFELMHGTNDDNEKWLLEGSADLAFVRVPAADGLESVPLMKDQLVAVVPEGSELSSRKRISLDSFEKFPYIALSEGVDDEISDIITRNNIHPNTQFTEKDDYAVIAMIEQGLGISIMPELVLKGSSRKVAAVPLDPPAYRNLGIAYKNKAMLSQSAKVFIEYAKKYLNI